VVYSPSSTTSASVLQLPPASAPTLSSFLSCIARGLSRIGVTPAISATGNGAAGASALQTDGEAQGGSRSEATQGDGDTAGQATATRFPCTSRRRAHPPSSGVARSKRRADRGDCASAYDVRASCGSEAPTPAGFNSGARRCEQLSRAHRLLVDEEPQLPSIDRKPTCSSTARSTPFV
jgi:hypothetical protein